MTAVGPIAEPLDLFKQILMGRAAWQEWAGNEYDKQVHISENRSQIETNGGPLLWVNESLRTPFSIIWMPQLSINPKRCLYEYSVLMMFQDTASDRQDHDKSAMTFASNVGTTIDEISDHIREGTSLVPNVDEITMPGEPTRVGVLQSDVQHDYWTTTFMFAVNQ
jgi:hypothetical protein